MLASVRQRDKRRRSNQRHSSNSRSHNNLLRRSLQQDLK